LGNPPRIAVCKRMRGGPWPSLFRPLVMLPLRRPVRVAPRSPSPPLLSPAPPASPSSPLSEDVASRRRVVPIAAVWSSHVRRTYLAPRDELFSRVW